MNDPYEYKPIRNLITTLVKIREKLKDDNEMSMKVAGCGWFVAMRNLDDTIANMLKLESNYLIFKSDCERYRDLCREYSALLGGHDSDTLSYDRKVELKALVEKWQKEDEEE